MSLKTELMDKATKVIDSCETRAQISTTLNYLGLVGNAYNFSWADMWWFYDRLENVEISIKKRHLDV